MAGAQHWRAALPGGFIAPGTHPPESVVIVRRDGSASRHEVTGLASPGSNPVCEVRGEGTPEPGFPEPERPRYAWKRSAHRLRARTAGGLEAAVFRTRRDGNSGWGFRITPAGNRREILEEERGPIPTRNRAAGRCEAELTRLEESRGA